MRNTTRALTRHYLDHPDLRGDVLEIGGHRPAKCAIDLFPQPRFRYRDLDLVAPDIPNTISADITGCTDVIPDDTFDIVFSSDVFEHIDRPWLAAAEIARILRPGGIAITHTLFSWRNHPELTKISAELEQVITETRGVSVQLQSHDAELARPRRVVDRPSLPERAYRKVHLALSSSSSSTASDGTSDGSSGRRS